MAPMLEETRKNLKAVGIEEPLEGKTAYRNCTLFIMGRDNRFGHDYFFPRTNDQESNCRSVLK
jgi:hypothetical protein